MNTLRSGGRTGSLVKCLRRVGLVEIVRLSVCGVMHIGRDGARPSRAAAKLLAILTGAD
jgi:hypothetical protein